MRLVLVMVCVLWAAAVQAQPVGETHRVTTEKTAALRDAAHRDALRITVWYPAAADAVEHPLLIGPPGEPLFDIGAVATDAPFAAGAARYPVILLSHGFGGSARLMGWFGIAMARDGYVVLAVDHPGNNGVDAMTVPGALLFWDRAEDLRAALAAAERDGAIAPHLDLARVGAAGFSAGGFTSLVAAGARADPARLEQFCASYPDDGICRPQLEFRMTAADVAKARAEPDIAAEMARATEDHSIPAVRAAFVMAPALVQALDPDSLAHLRDPVSIVLGDADTVAPPATNGRVAADAIPDAELQQLPGVGHYDFLATCTEAGRALVPQCTATVPQDDTHRRALAAAKAFFARTLPAIRP